MGNKIRIREYQSAGISLQEWQARDSAPKKTFFCIHGMCADRYLFENFASRWAEQGWRVLLPSLRGRPASSELAFSGKVSLLDYVADLEQVLHQLLQEHNASRVPFHLLGHSMGGLIAQKLAENVYKKDSGKVSSLSLLASAPPGEVPLRLDSWHSLRLFKYLPMVLFGSRFRFFKGDYLALIGNRSTREDLYKDRDNGVPDSGKVLREILRGKIYIDREKITCPVFCAVGSEDRILPPSLCQRIANFYSGGYQEFPRMAHMFLREEGWEDVAARIEMWSERAEAQSGESQKAPGESPER